jgi:hypothetical protein
MSEPLHTVCYWPYKRGLPVEILPPFHSIEHAAETARFLFRHPLIGRVEVFRDAGDGLMVDHSDRQKWLWQMMRDWRLFGPFHRLRWRVGRIFYLIGVPLPHRVTMAGNPFKRA